MSLSCYDITCVVSYYSFLIALVFSFSGRYVGSRPIKLRKSSWKNRAAEVVRKKEKEKAALIGLLTGK